MKNRYLGVVTLLLFIGLLSFSSFALAEDVICTRQIFDNPDGQLQVTLEITMPKEQPGSVIIKENLPSGWRIIDSVPLADTSDINSGEAKWLLVGPFEETIILVYFIDASSAVSRDERPSGVVLYKGADSSHQKIEIVDI